MFQVTFLCKPIASMYHLKLSFSQLCGVAGSIAFGKKLQAIHLQMSFSHNYWWHRRSSGPALACCLGGANQGAVSQPASAWSRGGTTAQGRGLGMRGLLMQDLTVQIWPGMFLQAVQVLMQDLTVQNRLGQGKVGSQVITFASLFLNVAHSRCLV